MSQFTLVSWLLPKFFPIEIGTFVKRIYTIVPSLKIKPGQIVFDSPCGHLLRYTTKSKTKSFTCPISKKLYSFKKKKFDGGFHSYSLKSPYLCLYDDDDDIIYESITCKTCKIEYYASSTTTDLKIKIVCFCGQLVDNFHVIDVQENVV
jgi:hypothetical protein